MINIVMDWNEIKRRAKDGCPLSVLADLNGVNSKVMGEIIKELEKEHGETIVWGDKKPKNKKEPQKKRVDRAKIAQLLQEGKTPAQIADRLGCTVATVYLARKSLRERLECGFDVIKKEETPDGIRIEAKLKDKPVEADQVPEDLDQETLDMLDMYLDKNIEVLEAEIEKKKTEIEQIKRKLRTWIQIKKKFEEVNG